MKDIAFILSQKGGIDHIQLIISNTTGHGCVANIGTHFNHALNSYLIKDPTARIVDGFITEMMIPTLSGATEEDLLGATSSGYNYTTDPLFLGCRINPVGMVNELLKYFPQRVDDYVKDELKLADQNNQDFFSYIYANIIDGEEAQQVAGVNAVLLMLNKMLPANDYAIVKEAYMAYLDKAPEEQCSPEVKDEIKKVLAQVELREYALHSDNASKEAIEALIKQCKTAGVETEEINAVVNDTDISHQVNALRASGRKLSK